MEISMKNNLCRGLRACGFSHRVSYQVMNEFTKWTDNNGSEWALDRMKGYHLWYLKHLSGETYEAPSWYRKGKDQLPLGIWNHLFNTRNQQKVLAMLSCYTVLKSKTLLDSQLDKFKAGVEPIGTRPDRAWISSLPFRGRKIFPNLHPSFPSLACITGQSIPVSTSASADKVKKVHVREPRDRVMAYVESWKSLPWETITFMKEIVPHYVPPAYGRMEPMFIMNATSRPVGQISVIQEPALKARWVANPNRITQHFLSMLGNHWYNLLRKVPTDCTYDQDKGVEWCQEQLSKGVMLAGVDMTSATDLLDRDLSVELVFRSYLKSSYFEDRRNPSISRREKLYLHHVSHFLNVSSGSWSFPEHYPWGVRWSQGQPLGTYPSFALLGLTNNAMGTEACRRAGIPLDSFRVIGDDIIMDARAVNHYTDIVGLMGGKVNPTKTLTSSQIAEFAGRIVTPTRVMRKTIKYHEISDDSFMEVVSQLGPQSVSLLRPRQRKVWNEFKYVPGIIVNGPWSKDSFGESLEDRYFWYLHHSGLNVKEESAPDPMWRDAASFANNLVYTLEAENRTSDINFVLPPLYGVDFQSRHESQLTKKSNDPRKSSQNGLTILQILESAKSALRFIPFGLSGSLDLDEDEIEELISSTDLSKESGAHHDYDDTRDTMSSDEDGDYDFSDIFEMIEMSSADLDRITGVDKTPTR